MEINFFDWDKINYISFQNIDIDWCFLIQLNVVLNTDKMDTFC